MSEKVCVRVDVLGPLRVRGPDGADLTPSGELPRRLLALLVLRRGRAVSVDTAVELLWPSSMPADPVAALQNHISRLRRGLPPGTIESTHDGYRLDPTAVDVDADRLTAALGADAADARARAELDAILPEWRGPAYPELDELDEGRLEVQHLDELRVRARERRAEGRLAAGDTDGLAVDLRALADEHPLRERPRALLMEVLAATGRYADALRVYDEFRRLLGDELGVEPSPPFAARHAELLAGSGIGAWSPDARLPAPTAAIIGRDELADELSRVAGQARLVTLVGPGGVGKTRLLLEIGERLTHAQPDVPIVFCDLSRTDPAGAADVVARALNVDLRPGTPLAERVVDVIRDSAVVVLLDNCEHVLDLAAAFGERVITGCPNVRVIATSRERLRVPGELVRPVPPLPVDGSSAPAVELFVERARAANGDLDLDPESLARVEEIVTRLDGLPLAIELAAARLHTHDLGEIAAGLDRPFDMLASGYRTSSRHGSLSAAMESSYGLLDDGLQRTFADVAVFAGPFDVDGAAAVCDLDQATVGERLTHLTERSLVMRAPQHRYRLLETLRVYGRERLDADGRAGAVARRHADHLVEWAEAATTRMSDPERGDRAIAEIDQMIPELLRALNWLLDQPDDSNRVEQAGRLVAALFDYGFLRLRPDVLEWAERVALADPNARGSMSSRVLAAAAYARWMAGDVPGCGERADRALRLGGGRSAPAQVLAVKGAYELFEGRLEESATWFRRAADAASASDLAFGSIARGAAVMVLGYAGDPDAARLADALLSDLGDDVTPYAAYLWYSAGETDLAVGAASARSRLERALRLAGATDAALVTGLAGASKASIDARIGDPGDAAHQYKLLIDHWRRAGMWSTQWTMLRSIATLLERLGRPRDAAVLNGAILTTTAGHRVFGTDEIMLNELAGRLRRTLSDADYDAAHLEGASLDGNAAVDYALKVL